MSDKLPVKKWARSKNGFLRHAAKLAGARKQRPQLKGKEIMEFTKSEAENLLKMFGGEEASITVVRDDSGLLAWHTEYPEEGSLEL